MKATRVRYFGLEKGDLAGCMLSRTRPAARWPTDKITNRKRCSRVKPKYMLLDVGRTKLVPSFSSRKVSKFGVFPIVFLNSNSGRVTTAQAIRDERHRCPCTQARGRRQVGQRDNHDSCQRSGALWLHRREVHDGVRTLRYRGLRINSNQILFFWRQTPRRQK